ncbi:MAG: hypothetical protein WC759_01940 [Candidatus Micrarchaeia archaeon]|jgi:hypothetical protein
MATINAGGAAYLHRQQVHAIRKVPSAPQHPRLHIDTLTNGIIISKQEVGAVYAAFPKTKRGARKAAEFRDMHPYTRPIEITEKTGGLMKFLTGKSTRNRIALVPNGLNVPPLQEETWTPVAEAI